MLLGTSALIVEDEYLIATEMQRLLEGAGAAAIIARTAAEGTEHANSRALDVALVALGPNDEDSIALIGHLQQAGVAVVAVSSVGAHREGIPGLDGVGVIVKPFTDEDLLNAAATALLAAAREVKRPS